MGAMKKLAFLPLLLAVCAPMSNFAADYSDHPRPVVKMSTPRGAIFIELYTDAAPKHAERILALAEQGFYNGILFHRIVPEFVAQAGDPKTKSLKPGQWRLEGDRTAISGYGSGGSDLPDLPLEVSPTQKNTRGALAAARTNDPNSANSQFYIVLKDAPFLDMKYTVFGRVLGEGMSVADKLQIGDAIEKLEVVKK